MRLTGKRAFALVSGLFIVLLVYLSMTIMVARSNQDFAVTRFGYQNVQASCLAEAGASLLLHQLNQDSSAETKVLRMETEEGTFEAHCQKIDDKRLRIVAVGTVSGRTVTVQKTLVKRPAITPIDYVLRRGAHAVDADGVLFRMGTSEWQGLPPAPKLMHDATGALVLSTDLSPELASLRGDASGNVYCISHISGRQHEILRYNVKTGSKGWEAIAPLSKTGFRTIDGICVNARGDLFAISTDGPRPEIYRMKVPEDSAQLESATWTAVPTPPAAKWTRDGFVLNAGATARKLEPTMAADEKGHLFVAGTNVEGRPALIYRIGLAGTDAAQPRADDQTSLQLADGSLVTILPPPLSVGFKPVKSADGGQELLAVYSNKPVMRLDSLAVDPQSGQLFARQARPMKYVPNGFMGYTATDPVDTIYRYAPGEHSTVTVKVYQHRQNQDDKWVADPVPPPAVTWAQIEDAEGDSVPLNDEDEEGNPSGPSGYVRSLRNTAVDQASNFLGVWPNSTRPDTVYSCNLGNKQWEVLPPVPRIKHEKDGEGVWHPVLTPAQGNREARIDGLGGGGIMERANQYRYEVTSTN